MCRLLGVCMVLYIIAMVNGEYWNWNFRVDPKSFKNRTFPITDEAPFATELERHPDAKQAIRALSTLLATEQRKLRRQSREWRYGDGTENPCKPHKQQMLQAVENSVRSRGFGNLTSPCIGDIQLVLKPDELSALQNYFRAINEVKERVIDLLRQKKALAQLRPKWTDTRTFSEFKYLDSLHDCSLRHLTAFRVDDKWALSADVTSHNPRRHLPSTHRMYLAENVYIGSENRLTALRMNVRGEQNVTTTLSRWAGVPVSSRFRNDAPLDENPAVAAALDAEYDRREQVEDLGTSANLAILFLPLATAFIPIATFADVALLPALFYLLLTDVLAMVPLAIKGVELIIFARSTPSATHLRMFLPTSPTQQVAAAEMWHATCVPRGHIGTRGITLLTFAVVLMIVGCVLEIYARRTLTRRKKQALSASEMGLKRQQPWWERSAYSSGEWPET